VVRFLKFFTFLSHEEIAALEQEHTAKPEGRVAHKALAKAVTDLVHGETATHDAQRASEILFGGELAGISEENFRDVVGEIPSKELQRDKLAGDGVPLLDLLVESGLCASKGQARKDTDGGGIYLNNIRQTEWQRNVTGADVVLGKYLLLRKGKRNYVALTLA